jgi:hypothetical protein
VNDAIISTVASLISGSLAFLLEVGLLAVALTIVRKRRQDASLMIAASAGIQMFMTIVIPIVYATMARMSVSSYRTAAAFIQLGNSFVHAISAVLLILGIVKLASDEPSHGRSPY